MSAYSIAKTHVDLALKEAEAARIPSADALHALLVTIVQTYKNVRGSPNTKQALEFQANNLADDQDYEFMRP